MRLLYVLLPILFISGVCYGGESNAKARTDEKLTDSDTTWRSEVADIESRLREEAKKKNLDKNQLADLFHIRAQAFLDVRKNATKTMEPHKAIKLFTSEIAERPSYNAYQSRGKAYLRILDYQNALADMSKALAMAKPGAEISFGIPAIPEILRGRGQVYGKRFYTKHNKADYESALADFNEALRLGQGKVEYIRYDRAQIYFQGEKYAESAEDLKAFFLSSASDESKKSLSVHLCEGLSKKGYSVTGCGKVGVQK